MSFLGQRGSVGQKVSIAGFLDRVGHLGGVVLNKFNFLWRKHKTKTSLYSCGPHEKGVFLFYASLLKIKFVSHSSNAFAVILPQQRLVLVSAHAQNFFS